MGKPVSGFDGQITKFTAKYRRPEGEPGRCGNCVMFNRDGTCDLVIGRIRREDVCDYFESARDSGPESA